MTQQSLSGTLADQVQPVLVSARMRWFWAGIVVGVLLALGFAIRQPDEANLATVEGFYTPNVQYGTWYLANNQNLFDTTGDLPRISNYTSGLNYGSINFTYTFLNGAALILSNTTSVEQIGQLYLLTPWQGLMLMPLAALALYGRFTRVFGVNMKPVAVVILFAFAAFTNYPMVVWAMSGGTLVPLGWAIFYGIYLALLARNLDQQLKWQWAVFLIICVLLIQPTYHTAALAITIFIVAMWFVQALRRQKYLTSGFVQLTMVAFVSFLIYHAVTIFIDYGRILMRYLSDIYRGDDQERLRYSIIGSDLSIWWHIVNYAAVLVPVIWIAWIVMRRRFQSPKEVEIYNYQFAWLMTLLPLVGLFFAWDGVFGAYARTLQYGSLLATAGMTLLLTTRRTAVIPLALAATVCVVVSVYSIRELGISSSNYITADERAAVTWIERERGCDQVVFTDFRIGTTMGYGGCFAVVGPTANKLSARDQIDVLADLFYDGDARSLARALDTRLPTADTGKVNLILLSRRFSDPDIGIVLPDTRLKPMPDVQWETYRTMPGWKPVYTNGSTMILERTQR